ncbi:glutamate receptor 1-like [Amphibalanus amphitrite]|uniref:glutamate receptor 1-like n=1 Tax=Amphibalanus amphitrite TaxID=1232801 RepID=UPI001C90234D|nr:glutamate receptor 1-like [Amphibalanus amphitrite]
MNRLEAIGPAAQNLSMLEGSCGEGLTRELRVTAIHDPPYFIISQQEDGSLLYDGYLFQLWQVVASQLCLRYRMVPLLTGGYGSLAKNGTWVGMVGELAYGRADVALTWVLFREDRSTVVDYVEAVPVQQNQYTFYVPQSSGEVPPLTLDMYNALWQPLHLHVWWTLVAFLFLIAAVLRLSCRVGSTTSETNPQMTEMGWSACLLASLMTFVSQGWAFTPGSPAARTVALSSWMLGLLIYSTYTANLISHLTVTTAERSITSLEQFSKQRGWVLAAEPGLGVLNDWKTSSSIYERELFERTVTGEGYITLDVSKEVVHRTVQPKVLTYIDITKLFYALGTEACTLVPLLDNLPPKARNFMLVAKGLDRERQAITSAMMRMKEAGVMQRVKRQWISSGDLCTPSTETRSMTFGDLLAVLDRAGRGDLQCRCARV